jgi:hypothetical protein
MNINGLGNYASYNFFQVSQEDTAKTSKVDDKDLKTAYRRDTDVSQLAGKKAETNSKLKEQHERLKANKQQSAQKKLDDTYAKLSDRAKDYLNKLKDRYGDMDIYVADNVDDSDTQSIMSGGTKEYSAMMDSATLEEMAANEEVASKYEEMISASRSELEAVKDEFTEKGVNVGAVGVSIKDDGSKTYYSIIDDSLSYYDKQLEEKEAKEAKKDEEADEAKAELRKAELKEEATEKDAKKKERAEELEKEREEDEAKRKELLEQQLGSRRALVDAGTIDELKDKLQSQADKVDTLKRSSIFVGAGIDASA